jgi:hypothetical protein
LTHADTPHVKWVPKKEPGQLPENNPSSDPSHEAMAVRRGGRHGESFGIYV